MNALATGGIALLAGAEPLTAARLGASMLCLQVSIGAVNDLADAPLDRVGKPAKPIPAQLISTTDALAWAVLAAASGLVLALPSGLAATGVAVVGVALGYAYDLRLSRTAAAWLPLSLALPLLPIFAWLGATGDVPPGLLTLVPAAVLAGAALITGNGLVDVERDALAGKATTAVRLGRGRAWLLHAGAFAVAVTLAFLFSPGPDAGAGTGAVARGVLGVLRQTGLPLGGLLIVLGAALLGSARASIRERGWELETIGTVVLGLGWLAGTAAAANGGLWS